MACHSAFLSINEVILEVRNDLWNTEIYRTKAANLARSVLVQEACTMPRREKLKILFVMAWIKASILWIPSCIPRPGYLQTFYRDRRDRHLYVQHQRRLRFRTVTGQVGFIT